MDLSSLLTTLLPYLPARYLSDAIAIVTTLIALANLALRWWKPPATSSRWALVYLVVTWIAQARGWNASAYQPGAKALMIPPEMDRTQAAARLGLDPASTCPHTRDPPREAPAEPPPETPRPG